MSVAVELPRPGPVIIAVHLPGSLTLPVDLPGPATVTVDQPVAVAGPVTGAGAGRGSDRACSRPPDRARPRLCGWAPA
jgi:hypothetical protein